MSNKSIDLKAPNFQRLLTGYRFSKQTYLRVAGACYESPNFPGYVVTDGKVCIADKVFKFESADQLLSILLQVKSDLIKTA